MLGDQRPPSQSSKTVLSTVHVGGQTCTVDGAVFEMWLAPYDPFSPRSLRRVRVSPGPRGGYLAEPTRTRRSPAALSSSPSAQSHVRRIPASAGPAKSAPGAQAGEDRPRPCGVPNDCVVRNRPSKFALFESFVVVSVRVWRRSRFSDFRKRVILTFV